MAINALRHSPDGADAPIAIGDPDGAIFVCPTCSRPVASGARRCAGCGSLFVLDVPVRRATALAAIGMAFGLALGATLVGVAASMRPASGITVTPTAAPGALPSTAPFPTAAPTAVTTPGVPPAAIAALRGTTTINGRIAELAGPLALEVTDGTVDASAIARTLRRLSFEIGAAETLVAELGSWDRAAPYASNLGTFYSTLGARVRQGLAASVRNDAAYHATALEVLAMLQTLPILDAEARALADAAEVPDAD